ncbi:hypothetical protein I4U23_027848 [Adineta vaga]|nr:hypothetical protein I4U23_027848 [Adineta vaga]
MIDKVILHFLFIFIVGIGSSRDFNIQCSKWDSSEEILFGQQNKSEGNDDNSLNLKISGMDINRKTREIAVLDDNNGRIMIFNRSNTSTIFAILLNSSNSTNISAANYLPSSLAYSPNGSLYVLDSSTNKIFRFNSSLDFGNNATEIFNLKPSSGTSFKSARGGLCIDSSNENVYFISESIIYCYKNSTPPVSIYYGINIPPGNSTKQLDNPQSIVTNENQTLFVNDVGNNRIQMSKFNTKNGTTLPANVTNPVALSVYQSDILVITTNTTIHLFNLTDNITICAIGCQNSLLKNAHNAIMDENKDIIVSDSNAIILYRFNSSKCPESTTQSPSTIQSSTKNDTLPSMIMPTDNCNGSFFGTDCTFSKDICNQTSPCLNFGQCFSNSTNELGYSCACIEGYNGTQCQNDHRLCKEFTCFDRGGCNNVSSVEFRCNCSKGYTGERCAKIVSFCANITCQNKGVCLEEHLNFTCQCLSGFYGRLCESTETSAIIRAYVTKSFGYIAILMISILVGFILLMDALKYIFRIDPVKSQRLNLRKEEIRKLMGKKKCTRPKVIQRFQYVN